MLDSIDVAISATRIETTYRVNSRASGAIFIFVTSDVKDGIVDWDESVHLALTRKTSHSYMIPFTSCQCPSKRTSVLVYGTLSSGVLPSGVLYPQQEIRDRTYSGSQSNVAGTHCIYTFDQHEG